MFKEFLPACETAILGKMARLKRIYSGRRLGNEFADADNSRNFTGHPDALVLERPGRRISSRATWTIATRSSTLWPRQGSWSYHVKTPRAAWTSCTSAT